MRLTLAMAVACLGVIGIATADPARASIKQHTEIPAQGLGPALTTLAKEFDFQVLYRTEVVGTLKTQGASGAMTASEALEHVLSGTGLTYKYLDDKTVTIMPVASAPPVSISEDVKKGNQSPGGDQKKSFWDRFRLSQATSSSQLSPQSSVPSTVLAQSGAPTGSEGQQQQTTIDEVIVTAQKREERLVDVPIAVTAVTAADIEARGVTSLEDMQYSVPGLTLAETGSGRERIQLDGVGTSAGATGLPVVGVYLDEMPITSLANLLQMDVRLLDMSRIEVLHGPQATLYGEGSMGGTIHYVTASPDLTNLGGYVDADGGAVTHGDGTYHASAVLNAPLVEDKLGIRIVAGYEKDGGWINSLITGQKDINGVDFKTVRAKILFRPIDKLSISLLVQQEEYNQDYENFGRPDRETNYSVYPTANSEKSDLANLVITYDIGSATLSSSTGLIHRVAPQVFDLTGYILPFLPIFGVPSGTVSAVGEPGVVKDNEFSEELHISSNGATKLNYIAGLYYRGYRSNQVLSIVTAPGTLPFQLLDSDSDNTSKSWAAFAELRYAFSERFEALLGVRHFQDRQTPVSVSAGIFAVPGTQTGQATFISNNPRLNVSYKTSEEGLVYANVAKGFRSGVFNLGSPPPAPLAAGPESLWTYTVGAKQEWFNHRLSSDISAYYNSWSNMQAIAASNGSPITYVTNTGKASGPGISVAIAAKPARELTASATLGYTDVRHDTDTAYSDKGDPIDLVAKLTYSAALEYRPPLTSSATLISRVDYQHTSGYQITLRNLSPGVYLSDPRNVFNARLGVDLDKYEVYLFGNNLTDNNGSLFPGFGTFPEPVLATPRTVGVGVKISF